LISLASLRSQLEANGEIDWVEDRQPEKETVALDESLVGTKLEVRWRYYHKVTRKPVYIWCAGEMVQIADGKTKRTEKCKNALPQGAVRSPSGSNGRLLTRRQRRTFGRA
jgi:hypothetical protein